MQQTPLPKEDFDSKVKRLSDMFETIPSNTIRFQLHNCSGDFEICVQKLLEFQKNQILKLPQQQQQQQLPDQRESVAQNYSSSSSSASTQKLNLPQLHTEMNKLNEKNFSLLEQKISKQESDISLLKDMIKARDLTIDKLQKELQELRSLREREKSSASVVSELSNSIKSSVDSGFKNVEDPQGVDFTKLIIEVKKQLAMSFLTDFKESRIDKSTTSSKLSMSTIGSAFVSPPPPTNLDCVPQQPPIPDQIKLPTILPPHSNIPYYNLPPANNLPSINNLPPNNLSFYPSSTYPRYSYPPSSSYFNYPPTQPSAPAYYPPSDPSHNQIK